MAYYTFIVNTTSNSYRAKPIIEAHTPAFERCFSDYEIIFVDDPSKLITVAESVSKTSKVIIACGGDGTVQSVVRGIYDSDSTLGVIPLGSGNDFVKSLGIKTRKNIEYYLHIIKAHKIRKVDIPTINGDIFINTAGIGFDGLTSFYSSQIKWAKGKWKYLFGGAKALLTAKKNYVDITVGNHTYSTNIWLVVVANGAVEGGSYLISSNSVNSDGSLELVIVPGYSRFKLLRAFLILSAKQSLSPAYSQVVSLKSAQIHIHNSHRVHIDGEAFTAFNRYDIEILPKPLPVITNI